MALYIARTRPTSCLEYTFFTADGVRRENSYETDHKQATKSLFVVLLRQANIHAVHTKKHGWYRNKYAHHGKDFDGAVEVVRADERVGTPNRRERLEVSFACLYGLLVVEDNGVCHVAVMCKSGHFLIGK